MTTLGAAILLAVILVGVLTTIVIVGFLVKVALELWKWFTGGRG